jgi:hypothetical protein
MLANPAANKARRGFGAELELMWHLAHTFIRGYLHSQCDIGRW